MIAEIHFNYKEILKKSKKVERDISLSSFNIRYLKKVPYTAFLTGFLIALITWLCSLMGVIFGKFSLLDSLFTALFIFFLVSLFSLYSLMKKMDIQSYKKIKKISKQDYQIYEYQGHIDGIYDSIGVSAKTNMQGTEKTKINHFILIVDSEKIYLNRHCYEEIKDSNMIKLYIAKIGKICVLFDYEKI